MDLITLNAVNLAWNQGVKESSTSSRVRKA
jgi:hypothetical protein